MGADNGGDVSARGKGKGKEWYRVVDEGNVGGDFADFKAPEVKRPLDDGILELLQRHAFDLLLLKGEAAKRTINDT